ncbi:MAG: sigma-70 family RNA polymerase sigma factor [Eubacteriales bacterium]|nr:sigma-70 family RNA polymerase sigma factor [Clostridiales bacterium]MDD7392777.1 sigma-70 family RNA polymerase sigma factor [Eubacteriales bacterium]MDY3760576.1 sigma-70 family RNA polymerase sigma factor [Eubacteriales bacterium]
MYAPFISATANSYPAYMREDLVQEGSIGLYLACVSFDPDKGVPFDAFAKTCIRNRMISAYRSLKRDGDTDELTDSVAADMTDVVSGFDSKSFFVKLREKLSELENDVLDEYLSEKSYSEIADKLNVSEKAVNNAVQRIRKKIRKYYEA